MSNNTRDPLPSDTGKTIYRVVDGRLESGTVVDTFDSDYVTIRDGVTTHHWVAKVRFDNDRVRQTVIGEPLCFDRAEALSTMIKHKEQYCRDEEARIERLKVEIAYMKRQLSED